MASKTASLLRIVMIMHLELKGNFIGSLSARNARCGILKIYDARCRQYHFPRFNMQPLNRCPSLTYVSWIRNFAEFNSPRAWYVDNTAIPRARHYLVRKTLMNTFLFIVTYVTWGKTRRESSHSSTDRGEQNEQFFSVIKTCFIV